jgi:type IV pilus assembly protein PilM
MIAEGEEVFFVKYVDVGGRDMDDALAQFLDLDRYDACSLRRFNGERREDRRDPEIERSVNQATRPVMDRLFKELAMCLRYHSVTFRGKPIGRMVLGGPEANEELANALGKRLDLDCEISDPFRRFETKCHGGRSGQWDVPIGLALREVK